MWIKIYSFLTPSRSFGKISRNVYTSRILYETHYETLKLPRNCTTKDVRDSFIRLSKQCHPDKNQSDPTTTHTQFVKINEAYSVLSHPDRRRTYDLTLTPEGGYSQRHENTHFDMYTTTSQKGGVWKDPSFWEYREESRHDSGKDRDYYGIKGLKRVHNGWIAVLCVVFSAIGVCLQVILIRKSVTFNREQLDERSQQMNKVLLQVQKQAVLLGNKVQLEHMKNRLNVSETSNQKVIQEHQETSGGGTKQMEHLYSTSEPSVFIVPGAETEELMENSNCSVPTLTYQGETLHNF
ncbi:dnaJ-like protein 60 isoform X2 [Cryptotermes secundus]|uniref:dnaJ-like protein 60 isoform X2 n=1 Tax=Cryptotermes secundus TaxID=105785 RepID=UPI000CD7BC9B|nr:dnaJ-like protein 60 isoform X2 [Cryptotermes secundus]